jgi:pimeloyl-ACP methyl ester carboxylesterase
VSIAFLLATACARAPTPKPAGAAPEAERNSDGGATRKSKAPDVAVKTPNDAKRQPVQLVKVPLVVPGFGDAVVVAPLELAEGKPLLVAAHGAGDAPDWQCGHWASITQGRFIVLCPRGLSLGRDSAGYYFPDHFALEREVLAAVDALEAALGPRLLDEGGVYTGYSQGATMGALMVVNHGRRFPHLLLIEGGSGEWTFSRARRFRESGGKSVAIVCGTGPCARRAKASATVLQKVGLRARAAYATGAGHTYDGEVGEQSRALFDGWLFTE